MFGESPLPPDLAEVQSRLQTMVLPVSSVHREELMYRAGWAAAEAASERRLSRHVGRWLWPATTAALAASVLVLATLLLQREESPPLAQTTPTVKPLSVPSNQINPAPRPKPSIAARGAAQFAMRAWVLRSGFQDWPWPEADASSNDDAWTSRPKTSRELLQELLPELQQHSTGAS